MRSLGSGRSICARTAVVACCATVFLAFSAIADDDVVSTTTDTVAVEIVPIQVRIFDRKGRPVQGLAEEAFEVEQDGRIAPIVGFDALTEKRAAASSSGVGSGPDDQRSMPSGVGAGRGENRSIVFFLDHEHLRPGGRLRFIQGARDYLQTVGGEGRAHFILASYSLSLQVRSFRGRPADFLAALEKELDTPARGVFGDRHRQVAYEAIVDAVRDCSRDGAGIGGRVTTDMCELGWRCGELTARDSAAFLSSSVQGSLAAIEQVVNAMSGLPGRKEVLLISDGLELRPGLDLFDFLGSTVCPYFEREVRANNFMSFDLIPSFLKLTSRANQAGVTIHTFEAAGTTGDYSAIGGNLGRYRPSSTTQRTLRGNMEGSLFTIANETGGRASLDANEFEAEIRKTLDDELGAYEISIDPGHPACDQVHVIRVKTSAKHRELRYQRSYLHRSGEVDLVTRLLSTVLFKSTDNPLGATLSAGEASPLVAGVRAVPIRVSVPLENLVTLPEVGGEVRLVMTGASDEGDRLPVKKKDVKIDLVGTGDGNGAAPASTGHVFEIEADLPLGNWSIVLAVQDRRANATSFLQVDVQVR